MYQMNILLKNNYESFSDVWDFLNKLKDESKTENGRVIPKNIEGIMTNNKYEELFKTRSSGYLETYENVWLYFPQVFLGDNNYWIVKANNLYQGRGLKLCKDKEIILKQVKKYFMGIDKTFKDFDEDCKVIKSEKTHNVVKLNLISQDKNFDYEKMYKNKNQNKSLSPDNKSSSPEKKKKIQSKYISSCVVVQKYLEKPLLYNNRKFDIRVWVLVDHLLNVFMFKEGHLKASSETFDMNNPDPFIHLTNYSVQKYSDNFSKYEYGNEISFKQLGDFLQSSGIKIDIFKEIVPKIKKIIDISMNSAKGKLNKKECQFCFQLFGYDLIIDKNLEVWLLEINDNPGLSESSPLIKMLVPRMLDDAFRLTLDKIFETQYSDEIIKDDIYQSKFSVDGYSNSENMFDFICNIS
jgi:hypothetical protein